MGKNLSGVIRAWGVPPNWSLRDWREEVRAEIAAAECQAERDYDPSRGVPREAYIRQKSDARVLSRCRREWAFVRTLCQDDPTERIDRSSGRAPESDTLERLRQCLERLPERERRLIELLFWEGCTESEVARGLAVSQPAVNKQKQRILAQMRDWMLADPT